MDLETQLRRIHQELARARRVQLAHHKVLMEHNRRSKAAEDRLDAIEPVVKDAKDLMVSVRAGLKVAAWSRRTLVGLVAFGIACFVLREHIMKVFFLP